MAQTPTGWGIPRREWQEAWSSNGYAGAGYCHNGWCWGVDAAHSSGQCTPSTLPSAPFISVGSSNTSALMCLGTVGGATTAGTPVVLTTCGTWASPSVSASQQWSYDNGGLYLPVAGLCAGPASEATGATLSLGSCDGGFFYDGKLYFGSTGSYIVSAVGTTPMLVPISSGGEPDTWWVSTCFSLAR